MRYFSIYYYPKILKKVKTLSLIIKPTRNDS